MTALWILPVILLAGAGVLLVWLGWGRCTTWQAASGWERIPSGIREHSRRTFAIVSGQAGVPELSWLGHGSFRIDWKEERLLIDPVMAARIAVTRRRFSWPCPEPSPVSAILLTHAHMDHLDNGTLEAMPATRIYLPAGSERFLSDRVRQLHRISLIQLDTPFSVGSIRITPVAAWHGGWRYPWQKGLFACGYIFQHDGFTLYAAGDSAFGKDSFRNLADRFHPDWAILPIGAYSPRFFLKEHHMNPQEAVEAARMLGVQQVIPCHFGTYRLSLERMDAALPWFANAACGQPFAWFVPIEPDTVQD